MPIPLTTYSEIKDNYCICYLGPCDEYILQLLHLRPSIEQAFPGIKIHIGCKDRVKHIVDGYPRIEFESTIKKKKKHFAYLRNLKCNMSSHPIYDLLKESNLLNKLNLSIPEAPRTKKCVICTNGIQPTKSLTPSQIERLKKSYTAKGYKVSTDDNLEGAGMVAGVECLKFYQAVFQGIETELVPTGVGEDLYKLIAKNPKVITVQ